MAIRYTSEHLLFLRDSPLVVKPEKLPPAEDWMGAHAEHPRLQNKQVDNRAKFDTLLLDQANRRTGLNHVNRNTTNPDDIVFAPPRMAFASSGRGSKGVENDRPKDPEPSARLNLRTGRNGELDADRLREGRNTTLRRRGDNDQDEGWSTVKPRKSFGSEGAERFAGRMGGNFRDEKKPTKDKEDAPRDRPARAFDGFTRDRESGDADTRPRNGLTRNSKLDSPWHKHDSSDVAPPEKKERDKTKSWRDRDTTVEPADDRGSGRPSDRRWGGRDREPRVEREPEWFDEPVEANRQSHTQQDFQKWMEQMKKAKGNSSATPETSAPAAPIIEQAEPENHAAPPAAPVPAAEAAPDKFFLAFGAKSNLDAVSPSEQKDVAAKPKATAKSSSRFTSFFNQAPEEARPRVEQAVTVPPHVQYAPPLPVNVPAPIAAHAPPPEEERQAFQQLLAKLQKQSLSATPPARSPFAAPPQVVEAGKKSSYTSPDPFQQYGGERRDGPIGRPPPTHVQEILAPRPQPQSARPEQLLQDLVGQQQQQQQQHHHQQRMANQAPAVRPDPSRNNSNTEFLMNLMRSGPDSQQLLRMVQPQQQVPPLPQPQPQPQPLKPLQMPPPLPLNDREPDFTSPRDSRPQRQMRPQPPPGFPMEDSFHALEREPRPAQPTQILQRPPPPPGLDQMPPSWMTGGGQMPPPQQRGPMLPPPGLPGGPSRNINMPHMFPPNFPPVAMPPPDAMAGMPPRNMPMPPPGFFNGPPHGFIPPGLGGFNGPPGHAESHVFGGSPFEARGLPPAGNGRGAAYGRP